MSLLCHPRTPKPHSNSRSPHPLKSCARRCYGYLYEVHEDVSETLHIVPPALLDAEVGVDAGVSGGAGEVLVFSVGDVLVGAGIPVLLGQPKVDDVDQVAFLTQAPSRIKKSMYNWSAYAVWRIRIMLIRIRIQAKKDSVQYQKKRKNLF